MQLYSTKSCNPKSDAQQNLAGRTHYVDDGTLKYHHARILRTHVINGGLLFSLIESYAVDMHNTKRAFRPVIFDLFGSVIERVGLEDGYSNHQKALDAMWESINGIDAKALTLEAIKREKTHYADEMDRLLAKVKQIDS